jgi:fermentation-respiration switch protein FrsA (DUF1100 family)
MLRLMLTVVVLIAALVLVVWLAQRSLIYFPDGQAGSPAAAGLPQAEPVRYTTSDGLDLEGWFVPAREPSADRAIIVFNGNAGNRAHRAVIAASFSARGYATLLVDYRGYGGNPGLPSEQGLYRDARAALKYLLARPDINLARIVYFGESLGAAVALELAVDHPPAALILRSPFSSMASVGARHYPFLPVRWLLRDRYPSIDRVARLTCPLLVIAGDSDRIIPFDESDRLYEAAPEPKQIVVLKGADHNSEAMYSGPGMYTAIDRFLR